MREYARALDDLTWASTQATSIMRPSEWMRMVIVLFAEATSCQEIISIYHQSYGPSRSEKHLINWGWGWARGCIIASMPGRECYRSLGSSTKGRA